MNPKPPAPISVPLLTLQDVYYILFRHKWLIGGLLGVTIIGTVVYRLFYPVIYESHAQILVKYVQQSKPLTQDGSDSQVVSMGMGEEDAIITAEEAMLQSFDVAKQVAAEIGPEKILAKIDHHTNLLEAASVIKTGLAVPDIHRSDIIKISFSHRDPQLVQQVVTDLISAYEKERDLVRKAESSEALDAEIDLIGGQLEDEEKILSDQRNQAGIFSLSGGEDAVSSQIASLESSIADTEADLAQVRTIIAKRRELLKGQGITNVAPPTNAAVASVPVTPPAVVDQYQNLNGDLSALRSREQQLLTQFNTNNPDVQAIETQIAAKEAERRQLLDKYPGIASVRPATLGNPGEAPHTGEDLMAALNLEVATELGMEARWQNLTNQLAEAKARALLIRAHEGDILKAQREEEVYSEKLKRAEERREEQKTADMVGPQSSSIAVFEQPTPPQGDFSKLNKTCIGIVFGGLLLAFGIPFLIELYLDQTLKRPSDVNTHLKVPMFVSMPKVELDRQNRHGAKAVAQLTEATASNGASVPAVRNGKSTDGAPPPWEESHALYPFFETLRDRLMTYFEMINLTHKPKLVAVTSCNKGAGVTTTAAGLAAALSQMGDGNVLLVNMNNNNGEAQHFYKGKLSCGLEEALEKGTRDHAHVQDNLYLAKDEENADKLPRILPKRFSHLVGKMKASDFDYIIFDMPAISQISITPRLARFMDMVLLVVESEKTAREAARSAAAVLGDTKTNIGVVLNKRRFYLPRALQQEI